MFRNLVGNAVFSPSVVSSIGFYVKRLKQEEFTRRLGLVFMSFAVALQSLAIISPPEPTIAAGPNNIVYSGVTSVDDLLNKYDSNNAGNGHRDLKAIFDHYGISRDDLADAEIATIRSTDRDGNLRSIGRKAYGKSGETAVKLTGTSTTVYERYLWSWDSGPYSTYKVLKGATSDGRWFAVLMNCGNIVIDQPPPAPANPKGEVSADCNAITGWAYDPNSLAAFVKVQISVMLKDKPETSHKETVTANLSQPKSPVDGNHGFRLDIPAKAKSALDNTAYSVVAIDSAGGGDNTTLAQKSEVSGFCDEQPQPTLQVCDTTTGDIVTIDEDDMDSSRYLSQDQCEEIKVCKDNQLVTIPRYQRDGEPLECPTIQVCRDGVVISITSDKRQGGDLEPSQCEQIEVCRENQLVTIVRADRREDDTDPDPELLCEDPFPVLAFAKTASNETQGIDSADGTTAEPGDTIVYTLAVHNIGTASGDVEFEEDMSDVLEYAELVDTDGGHLDEDSGVITWQTTTLKPGEETSKQIEVRIKDEIPATPSPTNNLESNNLELRNVWHDETVVIKVPQPITKTPEVLASTLPETGPGANALLSFVLIVFSAYFYARNRQLASELKLVQLEYANGVSR